MTKGYLIPQNPQPDALRCLRVFIPDDPLYLAALLGALDYFGQWTAWERDENHRGALAAAAWRAAIETTYEALADGCGDAEMTEITELLNTIISRIEGLENMNITVTQNAGCGCCGDGGGGSSQTTTGGVIINETETGTAPEYNTEPVEIVDTAKCRAANYLAFQVAAMVRSISQISGNPTLNAILSVLTSIVVWIGGISALGASSLIVVGTQIASLLSGEGSKFQELADDIDNNMQSLVCALYNWNNSAELGNALLVWLYYRIDGILVSDPATTIAMRAVVSNLFGSALINVFTSTIETVIPADFVPAYSCTCGATGDSCPTNRLVVAGAGNFPDGDIAGTIQGFSSQFNSNTGYHELIVELEENYCVSIDYGQYAPDEAHEVCSDGVMVASSGSCVRRIRCSSLQPFAAAVEFVSLSPDCSGCGGCTSDMGGIYPTAPAGYCYKAATVAIHTPDDNTSHEINGNNIRFFGTINNADTWYFDLSDRPENAYALVAEVSGTIDGNPCEISLQSYNSPDGLFSGTENIPVGNVLYYRACPTNIDGLIAAFDTAVLKMSDVEPVIDRVVLKTGRPGGSIGATFDYSLSSIGWLVYNP